MQGRHRFQLRGHMAAENLIPSIAGVSLSLTSQRLRPFGGFRRSQEQSLKPRPEPIIEFTAFYEARIN